MVRLASRWLIWTISRALAGYGRKHNFQWWTTYNLPFGKGQYFLTSGPLAYVVGGWKISMILSRTSGTRLSVTGSTGLLNAPGNTQLGDRSYSVNPVLNSNVAGVRQYLKAAAFSDVSTTAGVTTARFGTPGRDSVRGPEFFDLDASIKRTFPIYESIGLELMAESFDGTNTPQFANPASNISASGFGLITTSNANRTLRVSARLSF